MKKSIWIILPILCIAGAAFFVFKARSGKKETEVTIEKATQGDITSVVTATGKIYPETEISISSEVSGEIIELPVKDGEYVEKDQLLFIVNPDRLEAQVFQQEAALRATHANEAGAKASMLQSELDLKRIHGLFEKGYATQEQVDTAETEYEISKATHQANLFRIEQQEMTLKEAKDSLAKATIYAPISGTITLLAAELGDRVVGTGQFEGTEILRIADLQKMEIRVDVSETDIVSISTGDKASIEIDALPDSKFEAIVTEIANSAQEENSNNQDVVTSFQVKAKLVESNSDLRPGMSATSEIKTKTVTNVVKIPIQSVTVRARDEVAKQIGEETKAEGKKGSQKESLQRIVFKYENGKVKLTPVETGISDNRSIEITSGVEVEDNIVTGNYRVLTRELKHDLEVTITEKKKGKEKK
ncbi:efflux RND transporter periplasmic adaptor subunit [Puniceicoccaceae bacterium K14]|nr:efflux RND transporter periplasmic adaptor subunit [Puniceicoccaceae bacterium K14]